MERLGTFGQAYLPSYRVERDRTWANVAALEGETAEATAAYRGVLQRYADLGTWFDRARSALDAVWLLGSADPAIAAAASDAEALFTTLGAKPYLEKLESARHQPREAAKRSAQAVPVS
jgi:hypothetical protein